ncbi:thioredoxin-2-like [Prorops nasuta]|uniref:thioredoxin-2-like n=1 Tax=Prorops nasuta TaxID=863751 RepID=UPI0034CEB30A
MTKHIKDSEDLKNELKNAGDKLVVIDFFATWCGPCKMIAPKLEELAKTKDMENVVFLKVDVDECEDVAAEYNIASMPTFVFIKEGKVLESFSGANYDKLLGVIHQHYAAPSAD